jgi:hypothetical protein
MTRHAMGPRCQPLSKGNLKYLEYFLFTILRDTCLFRSLLFSFNRLTLSDGVGKWIPDVNLHVQRTWHILITFYPRYCKLLVFFWSIPFNFTLLTLRNAARMAASLYNLLVQETVRCLDYFYMWYCELLVFFIYFVEYYIVNVEGYYWMMGPWC